MGPSQLLLQLLLHEALRRTGFGVIGRASHSARFRSALSAELHVRHARLWEKFNAHNVGLPAPHTHRPRLARRNVFPQSIRPENDSDQENHDPANNVVIQRQQVPFRAHQINNAARRRLRRELQERPDRF